MNVPKAQTTFQILLTASIGLKGCFFFIGIIIRHLVLRKINRTFRKPWKDLHINQYIWCQWNTTVFFSVNCGTKNCWWNAEFRKLEWYMWWEHLGVLRKFYRVAWKLWTLRGENYRIHWKIISLDLIEQRSIYSKYKEKYKKTARWTQAVSCAKKKKKN